MSDIAPLCGETNEAAATAKLASEVAGCLGDGDLLVLTGDLGAGKTCFTQGLGAGLGVDERITSPTFTLVSIHDGRLRLNHLDVYRLDGPDDTLDLDLPDLLEDGVTVIEWGERIAPVLPPDRLTITLRYGVAADDPDDRRHLRFEPTGPSWRDRRDRLEQAIAPWGVPC